MFKVFSNDASPGTENDNDFIFNVLNSITDGFFFVDNDWKVLYWNKSAEGIMGLSQESIVGKNLWDVFADAVDMNYFTKYHQSKKENIPIEFESQYPAKDLWLNIKTFPFSQGLAVYFTNITAKKKLALEVENIKNQQEAIINAASDAIWSVNTKLELITCNAAYLNKFCSGKEIVLKSGDYILSGCSREVEIKRKENYHRALNGEAFTFEDNVIWDDTGKIKTLEIKLNPIKSSEGVIAGVACFARDITERKENELLIREQNKRLAEREQELAETSYELRSIFDSSLDIICSINKEGRFIQISNACKTLLGYDSFELKGRHFSDLLHPEDVEESLKVNREILKGARVTVFRNRMIKKNGKAIPLMWSGYWDNKRQTMFCVGRDASILVQTELLKAGAEKRFAAIVEKGAEMVGIIDKEGNYTYVSPNVYKILGNIELVGHNALEFIHPNDAEFVYGLLISAGTNKEIGKAEFRFRDAENSWRWIEIVGTNLLNDPVINGIVINSRDVTERKRIENEREKIIRELTETNNDLKQFSFITSHNLRAPLSNIIGITTVLDTAPLTVEDKQLFGLLKTSVEQLQETIQDLTDIIVIRNRVNVESELVNIEHSFNKVKKSYLNILEDVCVSIETNFEVKETIINKVYLESIFTNLVSNAIKYRSPGRPLRIEVCTTLVDEQTFEIRFVDNGKGLNAKKLQNRIFGLYQRFHENIEGKGLGLFMVKSQVMAMGGTITLEGEENLGATIIITLPIKK